ncbi:MAG: hypothetical protein IPM54_24945 [Polyangiaceae bacterium]|nr:hypothetical protein [Polyangiaceae bacterium]
MSRNGWWELADVAQKLGFAQHHDCKDLVDRLIRRGFVASDQYSGGGLKRALVHQRVKNRERVGLGPSTAKGGRPRELLYLSPAAVIVVASHARTPEAAAFRHQAITKLLEQAEQVIALRGELQELRGRVDQLERKPKQLIGPDMREIRVRGFRMLVEALGELERTVNGALAGRGLRAREISNLMRTDDPRIVRFRNALEMLEGHTNFSYHQLGLLLREARRFPELGLCAHLDRDEVARWFVVSTETH